MQSYKSSFAHFLAAEPGRLHFAAHSHHPWPDCSYEAHKQAWKDAAIHVDRKWEGIFSRIVPEAQGHIARQLHLPDPESICFAANTHEFVLRLHSTLEGTPTILCSDSEFYSFSRQCKRWREAMRAEVTEIPALPADSFGQRFLEAARAGHHSMIFLSQVFFNSGCVVDVLEDLANLCRERESVLVIDGYHAFMAVPTNLATIADRAFYIAGGYKYAMSGEGVCFMHCPPGFAMRPVNTGWFAGFGELGGDISAVEYASNGQRFAGATFDSSGLYRFNAVQQWLAREEISVEDIHRRVEGLQTQFIAGLQDNGLSLGSLLNPAPRGHFLTFQNTSAAAVTTELSKRQVIVDSRGDRLRFGFGLYHDTEDVEELLRRLQSIDKTHLKGTLRSQIR